MTAPKWYDITLSCEKWKKTVEETAQFLTDLGAERFVIGQEVGEGGFKHYQVRVVLKKPMDEATMRQIFKGYGHVTPTHVRDFNYCEKEGRFYRSWEKALNKYAMMELLPWQGSVIAAMKEQNDREVTVIIDEIGGIGKTTLAKYCQVNRYATYVPPMGDAQDLMAFAMARPSKAYIFDLPRSESVKQKKGMWSAVEQIKNGYLYDKRYHFTDMWIDPPKVIVFCNEEPPMEALSSDRWKIYTPNNMGKVLWLDTWTHDTEY